ncbi:hypothetical protein CGCSCA4_v014997 [Colletotrichum siamense]|uniref:Uncharacterized protein n=1 Tax=Colletotrichum siamense TaxID=690259 RepID=A0A9P5BKA8_COLSI|nr:hypothetical protein CGCSCA4_v014997 [Colletotrichum siamense]KAF4840747.1 hypothetical protein CGCSCA2_v014979 [Colletotrichum siamense]
MATDHISHLPCYLSRDYPNSRDLRHCHWTTFTSGLRPLEEGWECTRTRAPSWPPLISVHRFLIPVVDWYSLPPPIPASHPFSQANWRSSVSRPQQVAVAAQRDVFVSDLSQ